MSLFLHSKPSRRAVLRTGAATEVWLALDHPLRAALSARGTGVDVQVDYSIGNRAVAVDVLLEDNWRGARGRLSDAALRRRMEQYWDSNT